MKEVQILLNGNAYGFSIVSVIWGAGVLEASI